ncbi:MAG: hypothetical protein WDO69_25140 [Pseudomonadota bacterium]
MAPKNKLYSTGECWCGCGAATKPGIFFVQGHDKFAEGAVRELEFGTVVDFLDAHGYGIDPGKKSARKLLEKKRAK